MKLHQFIQDSAGWKLLGSDTLFANSHLEVRRVRVTSPTRAEPVEWTVAHRKAAVVVVPVTAEGKLLLVRQERVPIRETIWEFPAGQIDDESDPDAIRATGIRELAEEAGYELGPGGEIVRLGHYFPSVGFTDEQNHLLLARPVVPSARGPAPDAHEAFSGCRAVSPRELWEMIASGEIRDANTLAATARMAALGHLAV